MIKIKIDPNGLEKNTQELLKIEEQKVYKEIQNTSTIEELTDFISECLYKAELTPDPQVQQFYKDIISSNLLAKINKIKGMTEEIPSIMQLYCGEKHIDNKNNKMRDDIDNLWVLGLDKEGNYNAKIANKNLLKIIDGLEENYKKNPALKNNQELSTVIYSIRSYVKNHVFDNKEEFKRFILWFYLQSNKASTPTIKISMQYNKVLSDIVKHPINTDLFNYAYDIAEAFYKIVISQKQQLSYL